VRLASPRQQPDVLTFGPAVIDRHVATFDIAGFAQAFLERVHLVRPMVRRFASKKPNQRHRRLLRTRRERTCHRRTAEQRDELSALHYPITSSARSTTRAL